MSLVSTGLSKAPLYSTLRISSPGRYSGVTTSRSWSSYHPFYKREQLVYPPGGSYSRIQKHRDPSLRKALKRRHTDKQYPKTLTSTALPWLRRFSFQGPWGEYCNQNILPIIPLFSLFILPGLFLAGAVLWTLEEGFKIQILDELGVWLILADLSGKHNALGADGPRKTGSTVYPQLGKDEIRLLVLEPGRWDAPLECRLVRCRPSDGLAYEALSYAWGNTARCHTITCNGEPFGITENLESALRHLRHPYARRVLWVDAVCIDQDDADERGHQVRLMKAIFSQAQRVVVWLGRETPDVSNAFRVRTSSSQGFVPGPEGIALGPSRYDFTMDNAAVSLSDDDLRPLVKLMERPWFRRLWVLQEAALAREVLLYCGKRRIRWDTFSALITQLKRKGVVLDRFTPKATIGVDSVLEIDEIRRGSHQNLLSVLLATASAECTDLRDKIFGVLSLAEDYEAWSHGLGGGESRTEHSLEPDYTVGVADVFLRLAKWGVEVYGAPDVLSCTSRTDAQPSEDLQGLPSWVPDWTRLDVDTPFARYRYCHMLQGEPLFKSDEPVVLDGLSLRVPAVLVDEVKQMGSRPHFKKTPFGKLWEGEDEEEDEERSKVMLKVHKWTDENLISIRGAHKWVSDCEELASFMKENHNSRSEILERTWRTMIAGMNGDGEAVTDGFAHYFRTYKVFLEVCISAHKLGNTDIMAPRSHVDIVAQVEAALHMWSSKRRFAITQGGRMALVPDPARRGDVIVLVANSRVPHILRRKGDGTFSILGEAYLEDMQNLGLVGLTNDERTESQIYNKAKYYCIT